MKLRGLRWRRLTLLAPAVLVFGLASAPRAAAFDWGINEDYKQSDARGATDFDILLRGDVAGRITGGGMSAVTNPFSSPTLTTGSDAFGNTIVHYSGSATIPSSATANRHFGIFGTGAKPTVLAKAWSYATAPARVAVPLANLSFRYDPGSAALTFLVQDTSADTVTLQDVGYIISSTEFSIDELNRTFLPPTSFTPLTSLDHQYAPGSADMVVLTGVSAADFATTYGTVFFSGPSADNGGEWAEVRVAAAVPEPGTWALVLAGLVGLVGTRRSRRRHRVVGTLGAAVLFAVPMGLVSRAHADVFVLKLIAPAADDLPTIQIGATVMGTPVNVNAVVVDTGAGLGLYINNASATALGLNLAAGTPGRAQGVGAAAITNGVPLPAATAPTGGSAAVTPGGQAAKSPTLPGSTSVGPLPASVNGLLGSTFLSDYNYGFIGTAPSKYLFLAKKDEAAAGLATATAIASFLSGTTLGPGGLPAGTRSASLTPTPPVILPPGTVAFDSGFDLGVNVRDPTGGSLAGVPFILKSGFPTTLISQSLALSLGVSLGGLPTLDVQGDFGTVPVLETTLDLSLFPGGGFPTFAIPVGIADSTVDPLDENFLGDDILGQLPFWEVTVDAAGATIFSAAAVPEPSAALVLAGSVILLLVWRRRTVSL